MPQVEDEFNKRINEQRDRKQDMEQHLAQASDGQAGKRGKALLRGCVWLPQARALSFSQRRPLPHSSQTQIEIQQQQRTMSELNAEVQDTDAPLKVWLLRPALPAQAHSHKRVAACPPEQLAQTRLTQRSTRPNAELVADKAHARLLQ
jgi:hypothetical protein